MRNAAKTLHFPSLGVATNLAYSEATMPDENRAYASPAAKNVRGTCTFGDRARGGSRPGLRAVSGGVTVVDSGRWLWPNGTAMLWPTGDTIAYSTASQELVAPDGTQIIDPHEPFFVHCTSGSAPSAPALSAVYRDRLVLADGASWYCSRIGDHGDFNYGGDGEDPSRALAGNLALAGRRGETITALMPVDDAVMLITTSRALYMFNGDPSSGIKRISDFVGCISANAWCPTPRGVVFVSLDGVYAVGADGSLRKLSQRLPTEFSGWHSALLGYDPEADGVHIFGDKFEAQTVNDVTTSVLVPHDWFMDVDAGAFWPVAVPSSMRPTAICRMLADGIEKAAFRGSDGYWRMFDADQATDAGAPIQSELVIGPFRVSTSDAIDGILDEVRVNLGEGGGAVEIGVAVSKTAEGAAKAVREATEGYSSGYNYTQRARRRGAWACIKLTSSARWAYENILVTFKSLGRLR